MRVAIRPGSVLRLLLWTVGGLLILSSAALALAELGITGYPAQLLSVGANQTLPGWVSSMLLAVAALALALTAAVEKGTSRSRRWWILAVFFALISFDEFASVHDRVGTVMADWFTDQGVVLSGPFRYAWVIPGLIVAVLLVAYFVPFVRDLPPRVARWLGGGLALMIIGGVGAEMAATTVEQTAFLAYQVISTVEEALEMTGVVFAIHGVLIYLAGREIDLTIGRPGLDAGRQGTP